MSKIIRVAAIILLFPWLAIAVGDSGEPASKKLKIRAAVVRYQSYVPREYPGPSHGDITEEFVVLVLERIRGDIVGSYVLVRHSWQPETYRRLGELYPGLYDPGLSWQFSLLREPDCDASIADHGSPVEEPEGITRVPSTMLVPTVGASEEPVPEDAVLECFTVSSLGIRDPDARPTE